MNRICNILIGGGGTGGHVFPAIAIADALKSKLPGASFLFVGARDRLEMEKVPEAGYEILGLPVTGFQRRVTYRNVSFFYRLLISVIRSRRIIRQFRPDVAIGVGGYASGPVLRAASRRKIPILLQEQNSYAGITNRLLAKSASTICVAYEGMEAYFPRQKLVLTGNPVRKDVSGSSVDRAGSRNLFGIEGEHPVCLVLGGSLGARTLNESILSGFGKLKEGGLFLIWQTGSAYYQEAEKAVRNSGMGNIRVFPFISRMDAAYSAADLVVSRAGAITVSELCLVGKPVILVPSPNVAEDHQTKNAAALVDRKAAIMIKDQDAREKLVTTILELSGDRSRMEQLSEQIKQLAIPDASDRIADEAIKLMNRA